MKTGLGLYRKYRIMFAYINLVLFFLRRYLLGFDVANLFLQRVDGISTQLILKKNGATVGKDCDIGSGLIFHNCRNYRNLVIGSNCHIGKNCFFDLRDKVVIGNNVVISMQCTFITHIDMNKSGFRDKYPATYAPVIVGDDCYLGIGTKILKGVSLSKFVLVAAGSVVIDDFGKNSIIGGVPAKIIKDHNCLV